MKKENKKGSLNVILRKYAKRYFIDAMGAMASGLFASLLIGTIIKTLGQQLLGFGVLPEFLSGKGPTIPVQIISIRNSDANFNSHFTQAGINQTRHQLTMSVGVDVAVLVLGESASFTVTSEVVVAETIIVGDVPDTFLQVGG